MWKQALAFFFVTTIWPIETKQFHSTRKKNLEFWNQKQVQEQNHSPIQWEKAAGLNLVFLHVCTTCLMTYLSPLMCHQSSQRLGIESAVGKSQAAIHAVSSEFQSFLSDIILQRNTTSKNDPTTAIRT